MLSKNEIKEIRALGQKKFREERGLFVVEGEKLVEEALRSGFDVVAHYRVEDIGEETMGRISQLTHPSPALAVVRCPAPVEPVIDSDELVLALDGVRDPGNLGTILRIADWFGIRQVLASPGTVECYNPKAVQATMGAIFRVRVHYCDLPAFLRCPVKPGMTNVYGTFLEGDNIYQAPLTRGGILVMGSEADGISPEVAATVDRKLFIPPFPADAHTSESLNVAVATAICCSEFRRREIL
ncbi:MAG: RNA methyltransferase [Bacteroidales bacterium]|nr:RNA methyltransferase [Bacteroidales bacterium]